MNILDYINKINEIYGKQEPGTMAQEPRIGLGDGLSVTDDLHRRMQEAKAAWKAYKGSRRFGSGNIKRMDYPTFFKIWAKENMADGGRIGLQGGKLAFDAARRAFLKMIGAGAGTAVAVKTGLIGLSKKAKVADDIKVFLRHETDLDYSRTHVDFLPLTKKGKKILKKLKITDDTNLTVEDGLGVLDDIKKSTPNIHLEVMVPKGTKGAIINKGVHYSSSPTKIF